MGNARTGRPTRISPVFHRTKNVDPVSLRWFIGRRLWIFVICLILLCVYVCGFLKFPINYSFFMVWSSLFGWLPFWECRVCDLEYVSIFDAINVSVLICIESLEIGMKFDGFMLCEHKKCLLQNNTKVYFLGQKYLCIFSFYMETITIFYKINKSK